MNIDDVKAPEIELSYLTPVLKTSKELTKLLNYEHEFKFSGTLHLCSYIYTSDKTTLQDIIQELVKDVEV